MPYNNNPLLIALMQQQMQQQMQQPSLFGPPRTMPYGQYLQQQLENPARPTLAPWPVDDTRGGPLGAGLTPLGMEVMVPGFKYPGSPKLTGAAPRSTAPAQRFQGWQQGGNQ